MEGKMMHIPNIPNNIATQIKEAMKMPEGTLEFRYTFDGLFDKSIGSGILFELVTGQIIFKLVRDSELNLSFWHSSPSVGTRVATVNIESIKGCNTILVLRIGKYG